MAEKKRHGVPPPSMAQLFYAGHYGEIIRLRVDGAHEGGPGADLPFVVGALAFAGRLEEARALFSGNLKRGAVPAEGSIVVATRFFLGVAYCRAGRLDEARREFSLNMGASSRHGEPLSRFYVLQGLGCYRYFTGRLRHAARHALRALEYAFVAELPYGRLLATDLRGHALVQLGAIQEGLSLLGTARTLAGALSLPGNAAALDVAIAVYRARFGVVPVRQAIAELSGVLAAAQPDDSYSRRSLCIEMAVQYALAGEGDTAWGMLERLGTDQVPDGGDARARIRFLIACANVARLRYGRSSMAPFVSEARALSRAHQDITLEFDISCMEILAAAGPDERAAVRLGLRALSRLSGIARPWLPPIPVGRRDESGPPLPIGVELIAEDRLGALYAACLKGTPELGARVMESGHWGLLPLCLRLDPGRRVMLLGRRIVVEDHGNVMVLSETSDGTLRFLRALSGGSWRAKADLLRAVWGIGAYRPDAHDPVIHTAVSRLRALLGVRGHWIEAASGGYQLAAGVELLDLGNAFGEAPPPVPESGYPPPMPSQPPAVAELDAIVALLAREGPSSSSEVASHLGVSEMTALRRLRDLVEQGAVERSGKGKNTRYRIEEGHHES